MTTRREVTRLETLLRPYRVRASVPPRTEGVARRLAVRLVRIVRRDTA